MHQQRGAVKRQWLFGPSDRDGPTSTSARTTVDELNGLTGLTASRVFYMRTTAPAPARHTFTVTG